MTSRERKRNPAQGGQAGSVLPLGVLGVRRDKQGPLKKELNNSQLTSQPRQGMPNFIPNTLPGCSASLESVQRGSALLCPVRSHLSQPSQPPESIQAEAEPREPWHQAGDRCHSTEALRLADSSKQQGGARAHLSTAQGATPSPRKAWVSESPTSHTGCAGDGLAVLCPHHCRL